MQQIGVTDGGTCLAIIGLTRRGDLKTKLAALESGVDDILTIPFAPAELLARVIALLRRSYSDAVTFTPVIKLGDLEINILNRTVKAGTSELHMPSLEQSLLYLLAAEAGRVVMREEILDTLWVSTTSPRATSPTGRAATLGRGCRTIGVFRVSLLPSPAVATDSYPAQMPRAVAEFGKS